MKLPSGRRLAAWIGGALVGAELFWVVVANAVLVSGVIQREANENRDVTVAWDSAWSPWPGRAYVRGFQLQLQDPAVQFHLTVAAAQVDVVVWDLLHRTFHARKTVAEGVAFRFLTRVETAAGKERRLAAFPKFEGFPSPPLKPQPMPPPATPEELKGIWSVQFDEVEAAISELWFLEYRYLGAAHVNGGFALAPLRRLWVGPAKLAIEGGTLSAGEHVISGAFLAKAEITIAPVELPSVPGIRVLSALTGTLQFATALDDLGVAELYLDGVQCRGVGTLTADLKIAEGELLPKSTLAISLPGAALDTGDWKLAGDLHAKLTVPEDSKQPTVHASLDGTFQLQTPGVPRVSATLSKVTSEVVLTNNDLSEGLSLARLFAVVGEARVRDAAAITRSVGNVVPLFAPVVLGDGPLIASGTLYLTPEYALVRLEHAQLGDAELEGAAVPGAEGWSGAAAGHFGKIPLGLRLQHNRLESVPFVAHPWLGVELRKAGIQPAVAKKD